jgi:hypothetical protein
MRKQGQLSNWQAATACVGPVLSHPLVLLSGALSIYYIHKGHPHQLVQYWFFHDPSLFLTSN